jgi:AcrR family transcriptional regulator
MASRPKKKASASPTVAAAHEERRREVCKIAARIIARDGFERITVRAVAREAKCSTQIVSHYFRDKRELLLTTYREISNRSYRLAEEAVESSEDLQTALEQLLPLDDARRQSWRVWVAFWGAIANDPEFLEEQIVRSRRFAALFRRLLISKLGDLAPRDTDWTLESERIYTLLIGIATQSLFDPQRWTPAKQRRHLAKELADVLAGKC